MAKKKMTYSTALLELEEILNELNDGKTEIDQLYAKVKRAKELMAFCKEKLRSAEEEINEILE